VSRPRTDTRRRGSSSVVGGPRRTDSTPRPDSSLRPTGARVSARGAEPGEGGFTLFEVLVAIMVLAVAVVAALQLFGGGLRLARASADHMGATLLASAKLSELPAGPLEEEEAEGTEGDYRWTRHVALEPTLRPVEPAAPNQDTVRLARVTVKVMWGKEREVELATLRTWGVKP
jgi:prepilin-type N-terminal cleavage/methylation domain-containing protein